MDRLNAKDAEDFAEERKGFPLRTFAMSFACLCV